MFGKPFKFTPVQVPAKPAQAPAKADRPGAGGGDFIGVLENGAVGDETVCRRESTTCSSRT
jgi:hypothetical protein